MKGISNNIPEEYRKEALEKLIKLYLEDDLITHKEKINITESTKFSEDLGMDSLDMYDFRYNMGEKFNLKISEDEMADLETFKDCINYIYTKEILNRR